MGLHLRVTKVVVVSKLAAAKVGCDEADKEGNQLEDEEVVDEMCVISVSPCRIVFSVTRSLRWHRTQSGKFALLSVSVPVGHDHGCKKENCQEMMAEDSKHARAINPATHDEKGRIHGHQDQSKPSKRIDNRPLAALFLASHVACAVDRQLAGGRRVLI